MLGAVIAMVALGTAFLYRRTRAGRGPLQLRPARDRGDVATEPVELDPVPVEPKDLDAGVDALVRELAASPRPIPDLTRRTPVWVFLPQPVIVHATPVPTPPRATTEALASPPRRAKGSVPPYAEGSVPPYADHGYADPLEDTDEILLEEPTVIVDHELLYRR